jgi:hypothetical protein
MDSPKVIATIFKTKKKFLLMCQFLKLYPIVFLNFFRLQNPSVTKFTIHLYIKCRISQLNLIATVGEFFQILSFSLDSLKKHPKKWFDNSSLFCHKKGFRFSKTGKFIPAGKFFFSKTLF